MEKKMIVLIITGVFLAIMLGGCTAQTKDTDGDDYSDDTDFFPQNPDEWADSDLDGIGDNSDAFPENVSECVDSDADGYGDNSDDFSNDGTLYLKEFLSSDSKVINGNNSMNAYSGNIGSLSVDAKYLLCECRISADAYIRYPINVTFSYEKSDGNYTRFTFYMIDGYNASVRFPLSFHENDVKFLHLSLSSSNWPGVIGTTVNVTYSVYLLK